MIPERYEIVIREAGGSTGGTREVPESYQRSPREVRDSYQRGGSTGGIKELSERQVAPQVVPERYEIGR